MGILDEAHVAGFSEDRALSELSQLAARTAGIVQLGPDRLLSERLASEINTAAGKRILEGSFQP